MFETVEAAPELRLDPFTDLPLAPRPRLGGGVAGPAARSDQDAGPGSDEVAPAAGTADAGRGRPPVHPLVADLQRAVGALARAQADGTLAQGSLVDTRALLHAAESVAGLALVEVAAVDRTKAFLGVGRASTAGWLGATLTISDAAARAKVALSRRLTEDLACLGDLLVDGGTTVGHCSATAAGLRGIGPDVVAASVPALVTLARTLDPPALHRELRERALAVSPELAEEQARRQRQRTGLTASELPDGCVAVHGLLEPEPGQALLAALDAIVHGDRRSRDEDGVPDERDAPTRRADALASLARHALACRADSCTGLLPRQAGLRPTVHVLVRAETLLGGEPGGEQPATFAGSQTLLTRRQLLRLSCDADVSRVVLDADGSVLDLGRTTRTVTPGQWKALVARDGGCVVRGCRRRPGECEAHHLRHWSRGGPSDLANYALVCHLHHSQLHDGPERLQHRDRRWITADGYEAADPPLF